ncbi:MAG: glycosyltransferase family 4 protein [Nitrospinota bacterium]
MSGGEALSILQVVSSPWCTGAASAALELLTALRRRGHRVRLAAVAGDGLEARSLKEGIRFEGFRFHRGFSPVDFLADRRRLARLIREAGVQVVHAHLSHDHWVALFARGGEIPVVVRTYHRPEAVRGDYFHRRFCSRRTDGFLAVSDLVRSRCVELAGIPEERVRVVRGTVDTQEFRPGAARTSAGAALGLEGGEPVVGTVSRLAPDRGHLCLLEAFATIRAEVRGARLLIAGKGEFGTEVARRVRASGLEREVILTGFWEGHVRDVLGPMRVFVLQSSGSEGTGRALLEAMACGLPCVVTASEGLEEIVEDGKTGLVVPPADARSLAEAVVRLLREPERATAMGLRAREKAEAQFRPEVQAERTEALYRELLNRKRTRS